MTLADEVKAYLSSLGTTPNEVAESLKQKGIKGKKCNSYYCPIAWSLHHKYPGSYVAVGGTSTYLALSNGGERVDVIHSECIEKFILMFDIGSYPFLKECE